jgi:hypothetical protein
MKFIRWEHVAVAVNEKSQKKASKSKKRKKRNYSSGDSSDSEYETGYGNTGFSVDKHFKIDKPLGTIYLPAEPRPIKVIDTAPSETMRADEVATETAKTVKVTAVVAVMSIFSEKRFKLQRANLKNEKPSCQKVERASFPEEKSCRPRNLSQKSRKGPIPQKLAPKSKK